MPRQGSGAPHSGGGGASSKGSRRRRRRVFGRKQKDPEKHSLESRGVFADGIAYGVASWLWRVTTSTLSWTPAGDDGGGARRGGASMTMGGGAPGIAGIVLLVAVAAASATLLLRFDTAPVHVRRHVQIHYLLSSSKTAD